MAGGFAFGVPERSPYPGESAFFKSRPDVGGMATDDYSALVLNPYSKLSPSEMDAVAANEASRVYMRQYPHMQPKFDLTDEQQKLRSGYGPPLEQRETTAARLLSGDPSAGAPTDDQNQFVKRLRSLMGMVGPGGPEPVSLLGKGAK